MRYHVLHIKTAFPEEWRKAVFDQMLCNIGVDTIDGEDYYIPSDIWEQKEKLIRATIGVEYHMDQSAQLISVEACPDENWNATWEAEHPMQELPLGIRIIPHCAFGAGHHETTSMMIETLIEVFSIQHSAFRNVLDHGTGTGVLAIYAKRLGAENVLALDIDDKSVTNALENAALNDVTIDVRLSNDQLPITHNPSPVTPYPFHLILANIHRNILLAFMPQYAAILAPEGELWLSGFYEEDAKTLIEAARPYGLQPIETKMNGEWCMIRLKKVRF